MQSKESGFYYLQSRYYDPSIGRFINADAAEYSEMAAYSLADTNLFAYCGNNPVTRQDENGDFFETALDVISLCYSIKDVINDPSDPLAWLSLAADVVSLALPVVSGGGAIVRAVTKGGRIADTIKTVDNTVSTAKRGWNVGDNVAALTKAGNTPSWSTVRQRFWKNEAFYNSSAYSAPNVSRMRKGRAPIGSDGYSMELHHPYGRKGKNYYIFYPVTYTQHKWIHYGR